MLQTKKAAPQRKEKKKKETRAVRQGKRETIKETSAPDGIASNTVSPEERNQMIAEAAYFIAEHYSFAERSPLKDWLLAEAQVDALLNQRNHSNGKDSGSSR